MSDTKKKVTNAPPPITPLPSGFRAYGVASRVVPKPITPDWDFWRLIPEVDLWQAISLSMDIDPDSMKHSPQGWMLGPGSGPVFEDKSFPSKDSLTTYDKRLRLLIANKRTGEWFSPGKISMEHPSCHGVRLSEFSAWAQSIGWDIPPKLAALATKPKPKPDPTINDTANDEATCALAEQVRNGEPINWRYWADRKEITPSRCAKLANCIDPIKWADDRTAKGALTGTGRRKIEALSEWLSERKQKLTLAELVEFLGNDAAPFNMKQAVEEKAAGSLPAKVSPGDTARQPAVTTHRAEPTTKSHCLDAVIKRAMENAVDSDDSQSVMSELIRMAESPDRPAPILGAPDGREVKYQDSASGDEKMFTLKNLRDRMARTKWKEIAKTIAAKRGTTR